MRGSEFGDLHLCMRSAFDKRLGLAAKVIPVGQIMTISSQHGKLQLNKQIPPILSKRPLWMRTVNVLSGALQQRRTFRQPKYFML